MESELNHKSVKSKLSHESVSMQLKCDLSPSLLIWHTETLKKLCDTLKYNP